MQVRALYVAVIAAAIGAGAGLGWGEPAEAVSCTEDFVYYSHPRSADGGNCYGLAGLTAWSINGDTWATRNVSANPSGMSTI